MPIQPMSINSYKQIPEVEDVTPVSIDFDFPIKRSSRYTVLFLLIGILSASIFYYNFHRSSGSTEKLTVYQTSMSKNYKMKIIDALDIKELGIDSESISFGNIKCELISDTPFLKFDCENIKSSTSILTVDSSRKFQNIIGFGGAFTESTAYNFNKLPSDVQKLVIDLYFGVDGIGLSLGRIHINSCDFSLKSYSFDEIANDYSLEYFDNEVTHDNAFIIPLIRYAMEVANLNKRPIKILVIITYQL